MSDDYLRKAFAAGAEIFRSGDPGDCAYIVDEGEVEITIPYGARHSVVNRLGRGEIFGEMALIDGHDRIGSARAASDTVVRVITSGQILDRLRDTDEIVAFLLRITLTRYRDLLQQVRRAEGAPGQPPAADPADEALVLPDSRSAVAKLELESELREALDRGQFVLFFQPMVALADGHLAGFEALLRWRSPQYGLVPPDAFIPLAEETGLIVPICRWVLAAAARSLAKFQAAAKGALDGHGELGISVNVTKHQVEDAETIAVIDRIPGDSGISPGQLKLELTEGVLMDDFARARDWIAELKQRHIKLSIDDFGTGYSSLGYLHQLRVDELKIDRSFVGQMLREPRSMEIVRAIIGLAHGLGLRTVAEGIEQQAQAERLNEIGCDLGQGYHFARPMPEADVMAMMGEGGFRFAR